MDSQTASIVIELLTVAGAVIGLLLAALAWYVKKYHEKVDALERDAARKSEITQVKAEIKDAETRITESVKAHISGIDQKLDLLIAVGAIGKAKQ